VKAYLVEVSVSDSGIPIGFYHEISWTGCRNGCV
jgi:hypothetical protein